MCELAKNTNITCEISNIIVKNCGKQYTGETGSPFRNRIYEHIASVKNHKGLETPVSKYFQSTQYSHKPLRFSMIEWLGTKTNLKTQDNCRARELGFMWDVTTINPTAIKQFV